MRMFTPLDLPGEPSVLLVHYQGIHAYVCTGVAMCVSTVDIRDCDVLLVPNPTNLRSVLYPEPCRWCHGTVRRLGKPRALSGGSQSTTSPGGVWPIQGGLRWSDIH